MQHVLCSSVLCMYVSLRKESLHSRLPQGLHASKISTSLMSSGSVTTSMLRKRSLRPKIGPICCRSSSSVASMCCPAAAALATTGMLPNIGCIAGVGGILSPPFERKSSLTMTRPRTKATAMPANAVSSNMALGEFQLSEVVPTRSYCSWSSAMQAGLADKLINRSRPAS